MADSLSIVIHTHRLLPTQFVHVLLLVGLLLLLGVLKARDAVVGRAPGTK